MDEFPNWRYADPEKVHVMPIKPQEEVETIPKAQYAVFYISEERMKALADFISTDEIKISAVEAIGSFLWQQITMARAIDVKKYPEAKLSVTVDTRRCMDEPVLPTNYWGNFSEVSTSISSCCVNFTNMSPAKRCSSYPNPEPPTNTLRYRDKKEAVSRYTGGCM